MAKGHKQARSDLNASDSDDAAGSVDNIPAREDADTRQSRPPRAAKSKANQVWDDLKPRSKKKSQLEASVPENEDAPKAGNDDSRASKPAKRGKSSSRKKLTVAHKYMAPGMNTDEEVQDDAPAKQQAHAARTKPRTDEDDGEDSHRRTTPAQTPALKPTTKKTSKDSSDGSETSGEDSSSYEPEAEELEEESSDDSGLEKLEKDSEALARQFQAEAPSWADKPEEDTPNLSNSRSHVSRPPRSLDHGSDDDSDAGGARTSGKQKSREVSTPPLKPHKKRAKASTGSESEGSAHSPPRKKSHVKENPHAPAKVSHVASNGVKPKEGQRKDGGSKPRGRSHQSSSSALRPGGSEGCERATSGAREAVHTGRAKDKDTRTIVSGGTKANPNAHGKRKRVKVNENPEWADASDVDEDSNKPERSKRSRSAHAADESHDSAFATDDDNFDAANDSGIEIVPPVSGHLKLKDQHGRVRRVLSAAIQEVLVIICTKDAFPEGTGDAASYARRALINAAKSFGDKELARRLKSDDKAYWQKLASVVTQRFSNLRGDFKKATNSTPSSLFGLRKGDAAHVMWLLEGLRYIYPHDREKNTVKGTQPYAAAIFEEVITSVLFLTSRSPGYRLVPYFTSSLPDKPEEKEIPAALLALASTALYASIADYRQLPFTFKNFTVDANLEAYQQNIRVLTRIKQQKLPAYHKLMHELYVQICCSRSSDVPKLEEKSFLNVDDMED